jgi:beta-glucanase (GH16 family)
MKSLFLSVLLCLSLLAFSQGNTCGDPVWSDEFEYTGAPAPDKWGYDIGGGGWGNNELENYTNSRTNSWVENGKLYIKAIKTNGIWSSARLVTRQKGDWLYGRVEIRAKIPSGKGVWSAIWMLPTDGAYGGWPNSGEIDIMENVGYDANRIYGTIHTGAYNHTLGTQKGGNKMVPTAYTNFHDYAIEWDPEKIVLYVDDNAYYTFPNQHKTSAEWPFDKRFHLLMNIAIGGSWGGAQGIDPNLSEAVMEIEHVRIYNLKPDQPVIEGSDIVSPRQQVTYSVKKYNSYNYLWSVPDDATIISGQGTNQLTVSWGQTPGNVGLELQTPCDTFTAEPFPVKLITDLGDFTINNITSGTIDWKINSTQNNTVSFEKEGDNNLRVNFTIQTPTNNPGIEYDFSTPQNLKDYSRMVINMKTESGKTPSNMRIDLIDEKGIVETDNLFKIDQFNTSGNFEEYSHIFGTGTATQFNIQKVMIIRIYFNYGMNGQIGTGYFTFSPIEMKNKVTSSPTISSNTLICWPNPVDNCLNLDKPYEKISVFNQQGKAVFHSENYGQSKIDTESLPEGIYLLQTRNNEKIYRSKFIIRH